MLFCNSSIFPKTQNIFLLNLAENVCVILWPKELIFSYPSWSSRHLFFFFQRISTATFFVSFQDGLRKNEG